MERLSSASRICGSSAAMGLSIGELLSTASDVCGVDARPGLAVAHYVRKKAIKHWVKAAELITNKRTLS